MSGARESTEFDDRFCLTSDLYADGAGHVRCRNCGLDLYPPTPADEGETNHE